MLRPTQLLLLLLAAVAASAQSLPLPKNQTLVTKETLGKVATGRLGTPATTYWQGEVFPLTHVLSVDKRLYGNLSGALASAPGPFNIEEWTKPASGTAGEHATFTQTARAYATQAGNLRVPAATLGVILLTRINEGSFAAGSENDTFQVTSNSPTVVIQPLPAPAPSTFNGAVGEFAISSTIPTATGKVGEALVWTVKVSGTGNWPEIRALPGRAISKDFDYVKPVLKRNLKPDTLFDGDLTEELTLIPTKAGSYQLGPVRFVYFNPKDGKYQMLTSETITLTVAPAGPGGVVAGTAGSPTERVVVPAAPPTLPLDPQAGGGLGLKPWSATGIAWACLVAPVAFLAYWLRLAARRRWLTDALRPRREAEAKILAIADSLKGEQTPTGGDLRFAMYEWQKAVAVFTSVKASTPTAPQIAKAAEAIAPGSGPAWAELWRESNRVLFSQTAAVPAGWSHRARTAIAATPLPAVPMHRLFLRQNLFPAAALLALVLLVPANARADAGAALYRQGDFPAAESAWAAAAKKDPANAILRYNLSLAAAQQDRWSESAAHALAAFCLDPSSPAIRWQFQLAMDRAGIDHPFLAPLARGTGFGAVARTFSPAAWGLLALLASVTLAAALGTAAWGAYHGKPAAWRRAGLAVALLALAGGLTALASLRGYGQLTDRNIAVVAQSTLLASVPTEADTGQKTAPLPAGSLATVDGHFLTWSRLKFANGQTGWVRTKLITHIYGAPAE